MEENGDVTCQEGGDNLTHSFSSLTIPITLIVGQSISTVIAWIVIAWLKGENSFSI